MINLLQISQNFDWTITNWADIASVLSVITFFGVWVSIRENIKQRRESYKPHLLLSSEHITINYGDDNRPSLWSQRNKSSEHCFSFNLTNMGLGPSTDIEISWLYPKSIDTQIREITRESEGFDNIDLKVDINLLRKYIKEKKITRKLFLKSNETVEIYIPAFIFRYISFIINYQKDQIEIFDNFDIRSFICKICCKDIGGKKVNRLLNISPVFYKSSSQEQSNEEDGLAEGTFDFLEIYNFNHTLMMRKMV